MSSSVMLTLTVGPEFPTVFIKATRPAVIAGSGGYGAVKLMPGNDYQVDAPAKAKVTIVPSGQWRDG